MHETEADHCGLLFASWACYNPEAGPLVWQMMEDHGKALKSNVGERDMSRFFSTHPTHEKRIDDLTALVAEVGLALIIIIYSIVAVAEEV
jgi:Zn-dependent protease with chaperone function